MRLKAREFRPRTGPHTHRIVQPRHPLRHTTVNSPFHDRWGYLVGDHDGLSRLAALFSFAAFSRHTLVHVPLRTSLPRAFAPGTPVDLVLAHRATGGLRPSAWPALRARLQGGRPLTLRTDEQRTADRAAVWNAAWERRDWERRDWWEAGRIRPTVHARTLFLFGDRDSFCAAAGEFAAAAGYGPLEKRARTGDDVLAASLTPYLEPSTWGVDRTELDIGFRARPPLHRFTPPGRPASRRSRTAASA
ncbi:hypothetical protein ACIGEZ_14155 [Streptomyces sp. NPDC085481]|uniref:hypothetical protein n=1 Tax=Streptomyces sp. NPDC085481 TaxID=3365727 RepID=UPI0037D59110